MNDAMQSPSQELSRRECLAWLARASLFTLASGAFQCARAGNDGGLVKIADLIRIPNESAREIERLDVILSRTGKGVTCMSTTCTHRRNKLEIGSDGNIFCPAHNSSFDLEGNPIGGPATRALTWYLTEVNAHGDISVNTAHTVPQGQWAQLPEWARPKH